MCIFPTPQMFPTLAFFSYPYLMVPIVGYYGYITLAFSGSPQQGDINIATEKQGIKVAGDNIWITSLVPSEESWSMWGCPDLTLGPLVKKWKAGTRHTHPLTLMYLLLRFDSPMHPLGMRTMTMIGASPCG